MSSLLHRTRTGILWMLLLVLPLQGVVQWVAGVQGHRHVHVDQMEGGSALKGLIKPLRALLDQLHAGQDVRLQSKPVLTWVPSRGSAAGPHEHGGVQHKHSLETADAFDVTDAAEEPMQGGATAFLAWLPVAPAVPSASGGDRPAGAVVAWLDRAIAPPLAPPRA